MFGLTINTFQIFDVFGRALPTEELKRKYFSDKEEKFLAVKDKLIKAIKFHRENSASTCVDETKSGPQHRTQTELTLENAPEVLMLNL